MATSFNLSADDDAKFKELVLYISQKCASDPAFGATKLNKILFYSDFLAYANLGSAITNFDYQKLPFGPAPRRWLPIQTEMVAAGDIAMQPVQLWSGKIQKRTINLRAPNLNRFSAAEIALIDKVIEALENTKAEVVSEISHRLVGWKVVEEGDIIPYNTIFLSDEPLTEAEIERGRELARRHGLLAA